MNYYQPEPLMSVTVWEPDRAALVVYKRSDGKDFRVQVRQRPNPIGFRARLPGDVR